MKKIISTTLSLLVTVVVFVQTTEAMQQATKGKTSATPSQIAVSDPGVPNKVAKTAAPASEKDSKTKKNENSTPNKKP